MIVFMNGHSFSKKKLLKDFPSFYKQILMKWKKYFIASPITLSCVLSQFLWFNRYIKIDNKAVYFQQRALLRGLRIIILEMLSSKELCSLLISATDNQPTSQRYFDNLFPNTELPWKEIYLTARKTTTNSHLR